MCVCMPVCAWACLYLVPLCLTPARLQPFLLFGDKVLQSVKAFPADLEAVIGVMLSG